MSQSGGNKVPDGSGGSSGARRGVMVKEKIACHVNPRAQFNEICPICHDPVCGYGKLNYR